MGWIRQKPKALVSKTISNTGTREAGSSKTTLESEKPSTEWIEHASAPDNSYPLESGIQYLPAPESLSDSDLPVISPSTVTRSAGSGSSQLWLVIDGVVYDCTAFAAEHPGGEDVLAGLRGTDCSWQFWRFHGRDEMLQYGRPLRICRTHGMQNKFKERPRFVGLRSLADLDAW